MQMMGINDPFALNVVYTTALAALGRTWLGGAAQLVLLVGLPVLFQNSLGAGFDWIIRWPVRRLQWLWERACVGPKLTKQNAADAAEP